jgi:large subunit ribosomal protein L15
MAIKDRKIQKKRGTRNCGKGKKGSRRRDGGKGLAGSKKHKYSWIIKNRPGHFGSPSMTSLQKKPKAVNIGFLNQYAISQNVKEIDISTLGYGKVLGGGAVTQAITIKAKVFTEKAKTKLEEAGGKAVVA